MGFRIKELREEKKMTQEELEKKAVSVDKPYPQLRTGNASFQRPRR